MNVLYEYNTLNSYKMSKMFRKGITCDWFLRLLGNKLFKMKRFLLVCALIAYVGADVSHLSNEYLPPNYAASAPAPSYSVPQQSYTVDASAPAPAYSFPAASYSAPAQSYSVAASAPAPSYSYEASAPAPSYSAPAPSYSTPSVSYSEQEYAASEPAHSFSSSDGYRYKTQRRVVYRQRRRRDAPSSEYLPPAASSPSVEYLPPAASAPAPSYSVAPASYYAPAPSYNSESYAPAASVQSVSYAQPAYAESAPAHSFSSDDGYRYKTARRRVYRHRRF